ncbi:hypothetical protein DFH07DRAFT_761009 [Mycena maculata]|uniref:SWIM-type domain-containing protein n=1 Tax=Mycena maculata TaxID=230809 RepID=A0AAD7HFW3_9AGAR|nr:hypothetical protein DFH07DRAFT_761009 [Mycena maculata]
MFNNIGRFRDLSSWRKAFKAQWKQCRRTRISVPLNPKYRPDPYKWVCTCPYFVKSRFLLCKHLVQAVHPVDPVFFLEVQRNRTIPFWSHPSLIPLLPPTGPTLDSDAKGDDGVGSDDDGDGLVDTGNSVELNPGRETFHERLTAYIQTMRDFCDGLEYQRKFQDSRFLNTLERQGAGFFRLAENCLSREHRTNSTRSAAPTTWEQSTANVMFYRSRPVPSDRDT